MSSSILRYYGERGGEDTPHNGLLSWSLSNPDGIPFRGNNVPHLRGDEIEDIPVSYDFHFRTFHLWEAEDARLYRDINQRIRNGWYQFRFQDRNTQDHDRISVYMEWFQPYGELPNNGQVPIAGAPGRHFNSDTASGHVVRITRQTGEQHAANT